ncbi:hypothetical protein EVAR_61907_1 [Eumeta japonica]|uniref:Uncharacterized protein n=1 Tax=Eumeta variegata TaxID=151549 RepID=A0A4C1YPC0_EUMVA|nr:hypothetical protein EVAR_61907_1 [Eumeta japonica]
MLFLLVAQARLDDVAAPADAQLQHDTEVAAPGDLQLRIPNVPQHDSRDDVTPLVDNTDRGTTSNTRISRGVASALPAYWVQIAYLIEGKWADESGSGVMKGLGHRSFYSLDEIKQLMLQLHVGIM